MSSRSIGFPPLPAWLGLWRAQAAAPRPSEFNGAVALSDRTLDDIGAPDWLRAQARASRDDGVWWLADRPPW